MRHSRFARAPATLSHPFSPAHCAVQPSLIPLTNQSHLFQGAKRYVKPQGSVAMLEAGGVVVRVRGLPIKTTAEEVLQFLGAEGLPADAVHLRCQPRRSTGEVRGFHQFLVMP